MALIDRLQELIPFDHNKYLKFYVDCHVVGYVKPEFCEKIAQFPDIFLIKNKNVFLSTFLRTFEERTRIVNDALKELAKQGAISGWRNEMFPVTADSEHRPLFAMERAGIPNFGVRGFGVHLNGCVRRADIHKMWISRRAMDRPTSAGKLDQLVAGGLPAGMSVLKNLKKEAWEEAGMTIDALEAVRPVGIISYEVEQQEGLRRDIIYNFDINIQDSFIPENKDGEIDEFILLDIAELREILSGCQDFKFNSALVLLDYFVRHGVIGPECPRYVDIVKGLHM